jgi:putative transposase
MKKYKSTYRINTTRLSNCNYMSQGIYFITICTFNKQKFFGEIQNNQMKLNSLGELVNQKWNDTFILRNDLNLEMLEYVIMPNHFHGLIKIGKNSYNTKNIFCNNSNKFGIQSKNLGSIIRGFKSSVTTVAHKMGYKNFKWQSLYYDHVVRNLESLTNIQNYIKTNPINWETDKLHTP